MSKKKKNLKRQTLRNNEYYDFQEILDKLHIQSHNGKCFQNLMEIIQKEENILLAYRNIKNNKGSHTKGTDGKTIMYLSDMSSEELVIMVRSKLNNYFPQKVRRVEIPKSDGRTRPLGIPTISDRLVQQCILQVLEPICEAKFFKHSYGFRPLRSAKHAIARAYFLAQVVNLHFVVDIDIKGFFDNIDHGKLLKQLWALGIKDKSLLKVISKMLKAEIDNIGVPSKGTPQGGILSPLLSNVVLNELDWWIASQWERHPTKHSYSIDKRCGSMSHKYFALKTTGLKEVYIVRYADDFKLFCRYRSHATRIFIAVQKWLLERLNLEISPEKSRITNLKKGYSDFLGIKMKVKAKGKKLVKSKKEDRFIAISHIADKAKEKILHKVRHHVRLMQRPRPNEGHILVNDYNAYVIGIHGYYDCATRCSKDFSEIAFLSRSTLKNRLSLRRRKTKEPLPAYIAKQYGKSKRIRFVYNKVLLPISYVRHVKCFQFKEQSIFVKADRQIIHAKQKAVSTDMLRYLMIHQNRQRSVQYNDNRISLFVGQYGRCFVTGETLTCEQIHCHHKKPIEFGGGDEYANLVIVHELVHKLVHATLEATIVYYIQMLNLNKVQLVKLNSLREQAKLNAL